MKKNLLLLVIIASSFFKSDPSNSIYKKIQPLSMSSLEWVDLEWPNEPFAEYLKRCFGYQLNMQSFTKRRIVFQLFDKIASQEPLDAQYHNCLYDLITAQDISLLCGAKTEDHYVAQIIDRTQTEFGKIFLYAMLANPTSSIEILKERQEIIKYLVDHNELYNELHQNIFAHIAQQENIALSFWGQDGFQQSSKRCYFSVPLIKKLDSFLNNSEILLGAKSLWDHQTRVVSTLFGFGATVLLPLYSLSLLSNIKSETLTQCADHFQRTGPYILGALIAYFKSNHLVDFGGSLLAAFYSGIFFKEGFDWARDNFSLELFLQKKLMVIAHFFKTTTQLKKLFQHHPHFVKICPSAQKILKTLNEIERNKKANKFFKLLNSDTFKGTASIFSHKGRILIAYRLMHELKEDFEQLFLLLGQLEAYLSCATLFKEFADQEVTFCFVDYENKETPHIHFTDFWNPLIDHRKVITNTIEMGEKKRRNCIITGPNAGGKSALIKGLVINLILAQSIGLTAAQNAQLTPFCSIATYLNIVDDIASGNSLFKAQVLRAQEMICLAETTSSDSFSFIALDEMFNGTSAKESKAAAYSVAYHLGTIQNCMCVLATHFPLLTSLEKKSDAFTNYKVSVEVNPIQGIYYPFKIQEGISDQHIALDILQQEGFNSAIIENASRFLKNL
jgi:DNA mismatch repair protein MutS